MITLDTSKESSFHADLKYIKLTKNLCYPSKVKSLRKFGQLLEKGRKTPKHQVILMKIAPSDSAHYRTPVKSFEAPMYQNREFAFFVQRKIIEKYLFVFFSIFSPGAIRVEPMILEDRDGVHLIGNQK